MQHLFGTPFWNTFLEHRFGTPFWNTFLEHRFGTPFLEHLFWNTFFWNTFFGTPFLEHLFWNTFFGTPFFGTPFWNTFLEHLFGTPFWNTCFGTPVLEHLFGTPFWNTCFGTPVLEHLFWNTCFGTPVLEHLFWNTCFGTPVLEHLFWNTCFGTPVLEHLFWNTCFGTPVLEHLFWNTCFGTPVLEHLFWNTCFGTPVLEHLFWNTCFGTPVLEHLFWNTCFGTHVLEHLFWNTCFGTPFWNTFLEHLFGTPFWNTFLEHLIGTPFWNTLLEHLIGTPFWNTFLEHLFGTPFWNTFLEHLFGTPFWNTFLEHLFGTPFWNTFLEHLFGTPFWNTFEHLFGTPFWNTFLEHLSRKPFNLFFGSGCSTRISRKFCGVSFSEDLVHPQFGGLNLDATRQPSMSTLHRRRTARARVWRQPKEVAKDLPRRIRTSRRCNHQCAPAPSAKIAQPKRVCGRCPTSGGEAPGSDSSPRGRLSCSSGTEGSVAEGPCPSPSAPSRRSGRTHREARRLKEDTTELEAKILDGERRLVALQEEARARSSPFNTVPDPQEEIRQLRTRIAELEGCSAAGDVIPSKRPKTLSSCSLNLVPLDFDVHDFRTSRRADEGPVRVSEFREAKYGLRGVRLGEASNPCPHCLVFRRRHQGRSVSSDAVVDLTGTAVDSDAVARHLLTDSEGTESIASSGFLNMFAEDLQLGDSAVRPTRVDTQEDVESDDESVASGRSGVSEFHLSGVAESDVEVTEEPPSLSVELGTPVFREGLESLDAIDLAEVWKIRGNLMKTVPRFLQGVCRISMRQALEAVVLGEERGDVLLQTRPTHVPVSSKSRRPGSQEDNDGQSGSLFKGGIGSNWLRRASTARRLAGKHDVGGGQAAMTSRGELVGLSTWFS